MSELDYVDVPLQVRYSETDQMGRAYYGEYFVWFEVARTTYCKARGFSYADLERETSTFLPVVETSCRYLRPLAYDDEFVVRTRVVELRSRSMTFSYEVRGGAGEQIAIGQSRHVFTGPEGRPRKLPEAYRRFFKIGQILSSGRPEPE